MQQIQCKKQCEESLIKLHHLQWQLQTTVDQIDIALDCLKNCTNLDESEKIIEVFQSGILKQKQLEDTILALKNQINDYNNRKIPYWFENNFIRYFTVVGDQIISTISDKYLKKYIKHVNKHKKNYVDTRNMTPYQLKKQQQELFEVVSQPNFDNQLAYNTVVRSSLNPIESGILDLHGVPANNSKIQHIIQDLKNEVTRQPEIQSKFVAEVYQRKYFVVKIITGKGIGTVVTKTPNLKWCVIECLRKKKVYSLMFINEGNLWVFIEI